MKYQHEFTLSREYFAECYDQCLPYQKQQTPRYALMAGLVIVGIAILSFEITHGKVGILLFALAALEWLSFKYRRSWWLLRQVWSRNGGNKVTLTVSDTGITTQGAYTHTQLQWQEVSDVIDTPEGLLLTLQSGAKNYLSSSILTPQVIAHIKVKCHSEQQQA
ncbi:YcxB family protein [Motilimonas pumila]|uniref:YcxB family protein n=1 Tax=Motilimonas pumila TaxID=2303987 RepID=A0A418YBP1_9GAMM|nr:YcxB family protein [Motilimonas pumila]RJG41846.1 YcxB family protein [Motilimonas pumila]